MGAMLVRSIGASAPADTLAELTPLEDQPATHAALRHQLRGDQESPHQGGPEHEGGEDEGSSHSPLIGRTRAVD